MAGGGTGWTLKSLPTQNILGFHEQLELPLDLGRMAQWEMLHTAATFPFMTVFALQ